jgi:hypothetical protein
MSLYKMDISDKTTNAMQNSDPEIQQMMLENAQQNNQTQPPASNGIMDIIKELFGYGDAGASDLGEIANLQSILNPITPESIPERKGPFDGPFRPELNDPYRSVIGLMPDPNFPQFAKTDMGATGTVPTLKEGILSQVDSRFPLYDDFTVAEQGDDLEENAVTVDELGNLKQPSGIEKLLSYAPFGENSILGRVIRSLPQESPEIRGMKNFYGNRYGLTDTGQVASGIMKGYNPVSGGFLNFITGGRFGKPTSYGLADAMQRRIENILGRKAAQTDASRAKVAELRNLQRKEIQDRANRGESLSDIGKSTFSGKGMAFEKKSGGSSGVKGTSSERNYGGR